MRARRRGYGAALLAITALIPGTISRAEIQGSGDLERRIALFTRYLDPLRTQAAIPGLSATIVSGGRVIWEAGFGYADVERRIAATPDTPSASRH
jgi:CubicO group peptidase (beta-lactamase class C family)